MFQIQSRANPSGNSNRKTNVQNPVTLIRNVISLKSSEYLTLKPDPNNIGSQDFDFIANPKGINETYVVKTIQFDDILPVLKGKQIRHAIMKMDIQ
ncbi:unnamed protein product [Adineta ricciae]|uniref:Uncharacterized protein n=1 Tax=Adineta ricciae TaxID=249248 RepID=A0A815AF60_ADIRI|nr:unnamed protein product [Adineta ricciae]CAF1391634.1 unnamed protein product [Adineta ricciae]